MALHVAGHGVGPALLARTLGQHGGKAGTVLTQQGVVDAVAQQSQQVMLGVVAIIVGAIIGGHAGAAVAYQTGFL